MAPFDAEALYKLPRDARYVNISVFWIPYFPRIVRLLYRLRVRHELVTFASIASGLVAAWVIGSADSYGSLLAAAILVHLKDLFDACDGSLARLTGTGHRIGRFLDTIGDGIVFTALITAVAFASIDSERSLPGTVIWAVITWLSLFLQCSYFNLYHLIYTDRVGGNTLSRLDDASGVAAAENKRGGALLSVLMAIYRVWFGWQDRLVQAIDQAMRGRSGIIVADFSADDTWYADRRFLTANSALCYGTHAFVLIGCLLLGKPGWFFPAVAVGMNVYWLGILTTRYVAYKGMTA